MAEIPASALDARDRKRFANAQLAMERGNAEYAVELCGSILEEQPACLEARRLLRKAQQRLYGEKSGSLNRVFTSVFGLAVAAVGNIYLKRDPAKALAMAEMTLNSDPYHAKALSLAARGAESLGLYETEAFCLETICDRYPDNADKLERLCEALINVGHTDKALSIAERLTTLRPSNTHVQELVKSASVAHSINKGKWADSDKDFRSKLKDQRESETLERANRVAADDSVQHSRIQDLLAQIHRDPQNLDVYKMLVRALIAQEDYDRALQWMDKAFALPQAEADATLRQLRSELRVRRLEQEIYDLRAKGEGDDPAFAERIREREDELKQLRLEEAEKLVSQFPNDYIQRFKYGELLLAHGDVDGAIQQFQISQRSPSLKMRSLVLLGKCFMAKGLYDLAHEQFETASEGVTVMDDFKKEVLYQLALCCENLKRKEEAMRHYKAIYSNDIGFRDVARKIDSFYGGKRRR